MPRVIPIASAAMNEFSVSGMSPVLYLLMVDGGPQAQTELGA